MSFLSSASLLTKLAHDKKIAIAMKAAVKMLTGALKRNRKVLVAGNGGSAAEAQHFSAEIVGRFVKERKGYPAIALSTDSSIVTAISNDYGYEAVFARQIEAYGVKGDVLVILSTSGNSMNLVHALGVARKRGVNTIALLGKKGGQMKGRADVEIVVPSDETARIQEAHLCIIHALCDGIDRSVK